MADSVAVVRERFVTRSELDNYDVDDFDITVVGSHGESYDGPLGYETFLSPASAPGVLKEPVQAAANLLTGSSTYMYGLTGGLSDYDIIHTVETFHGFSEQAVDAKEKHGCAVVCTVWENIPYFCEDSHYSRTLRERLKHRDATRIKRKVREHVDMFLPVTERAAHALRTEGVEDERIEVVPIGVDTERFSPGRFREENRTADEFGLIDDQETVNVVFVGRYTWSKGMYDLLSAWKQVVATTDRSVHLTFVGGGGELSKTRSFAEHADVPNVTIRERVPYKDVPLVFNAADLTVVPSIPMRQWQEQYGRVILESQAAGTPVIASATGGIPEAMGGVGELFQPGDAYEIAETIRVLIEDDSRRSELAEASRHWVEQNRSVAQTRQKIAKIYRQVQ